MMKRLIFILLLFPLLSIGQIRSGANIWYSPYKYVADDISQWTAGTGTYVNGSDATRNYIECTSDGHTYMESTQAYGEWRFDLYKGNTANTTLIAFMADAPGSYDANGNNYLLYFDVNERITFARTIASSFVTLCYTAVSYVAINTWYTIRITRSASGVFYFYISGGIYDKWTLINFSGLGSNPITDNTHTTSAYIISNVNTDDRISNVTFKDNYKTVVK